MGDVPEDCNSPFNVGPYVHGVLTTLLLLCNALALNPWIDIAIKGSRFFDRHIPHVSILCLLHTHYWIRMPPPPYLHTVSDQRW